MSSGRPDHLELTECDLLRGIQHVQAGPDLIQVDPLLDGREETHIFSEA